MISNLQEGKERVWRLIGMVISLEVSRTYPDIFHQTIAEADSTVTSTICNSDFTESMSGLIIEI